MKKTILKWITGVFTTILCFGMSVAAENINENIQSGVPVTGKLEHNEIAMYSFTPTESGYATFKLEPSKEADLGKLSSREWKIALFNEEGQDCFDKKGKSFQSYPISLEKGKNYTVYVQNEVHRPNQYQPFQLTYTMQSDTSWEVEDNNIPSRANYLEAGKKMCGSLHRKDTVDIYKINIDKQSKVSLSFFIPNTTKEEDLSDGWKIKVFRDNERLWDLSNIKDVCTNELYLSPGTYYIEVSSVASYSVPQSAYEISYTAEPTRIVAEWDRVGSKFATNGDGETFYKDKTTGKVSCFDASGAPVINDFKCDGTYTYYFQADGTAMCDRLTYHPDGVHVIYFDEWGHEVFSNYAHITKSISGAEVDDYCFFDTFGYLYVDVLTYDESGRYLLYANPYGRLEKNTWFQFSDTVKWADGTPCEGIAGQWGFADMDCHLVTNKNTVFPDGRTCYLQGNGVALFQ